MKKGLYGKYVIEKADGSEVDKGADYFVLRLDKDIHARKAALGYAESVSNENPILAIELNKRISKYNKCMWSKKGE